MPSLDETLTPQLKALREKHRYRERFVCGPEQGAYVLRGDKKLLSFASNDYFGLTQHPRVLAAAGAHGAGASALVTGYHEALRKLESALAAYKQTEAALVFGSGYLANLGVITALAGRDDLILADKLSHACILDGAMLSGATLRRFAHNDLAHLKRLLDKRAGYRRCLIVTETVFSMDGDAAPLAELYALARAYDAWLLTDDAHGLGLLAPHMADIQIGTLSKGLGAYGGYVCGSKLLIEALVNIARPYIFTTALPPSLCSAALEALTIVRNDSDLVQKPLESARYFTRALGIAEAQSAIVPLIIGADGDAVAAAKKLEEAGFLVACIRPPTVAQGTARLRFAFSAHHQRRDIDRLIEAIKTHEIFKNTHH